MSELMKTISFERLIDLTIEDYYTKGKIFEIEEKNFYRGETGSALIGAAAGPHTQLAQNILVSYLTGSRYFEMKTVQVIDGKDMQAMIPRPCIDVKNVGYNVEWSTELTVEEATSEYIKASILLQVFGIELGLSGVKDFIINASMGYNLEGIKSKKISDFIDNLKEAKDTDTFKECIEVLKANIHKFKKFKLEDIDGITSQIADSFSLSTMHGCKPEEILAIGTHLLDNKKVSLYIKCNSTLLGYENVREVLDNLGYDDIVLKRQDFDNDLQYDIAVNIISKLIKLGEENHVTFGVKLTNTLPVYNSRNVLPGEAMYLSGKPLYPIAIGVANMLATTFEGNLHISFSGGIDKHNIIKVLETGINPITFSTILLKPRGYMNTNSIAKEAGTLNVTTGKINLEKLSTLAEEAKQDKNHKNKGDGKVLEDTLTAFDCFKGKCGICVDICPNRANMKITDESFTSAYQILHVENRCNECGNCQTFCPKGGAPYFKKVTLYADLEEYNDSKNPGFAKVGETKFQVRTEDGKEYIYDREESKEKTDIEKFIDTVNTDYPYLVRWDEKGNVQ